MSAVDLTKCQPGDRLRLRDGSKATYMRGLSKNPPFNHYVYRNKYDGSSSYTDDGNVFFGEQSGRDVVAIVHPTRAELEEQRRELLAEMKRYAPIISAAEDNPELWAQACKGTGIATSNAYFNAIARAEATHE